MKVQEFINGYNALKTSGEKEKYLKSNLNVKGYVSFEKKINTTGRIAKQSTHKYDDGGKELGIKVNSVVRYLLFILNVIDLYTDIEVDFKNIVGEFDLLSENGLINEILQAIPESAVNEIQTYINMQVDDIMTNELSTQAFIGSQVERFGDLIGTVLKPVIEKVGTEIGNLDDEKINKISNSLEKALKRVK